MLFKYSERQTVFPDASYSDPLGPLPTRPRTGAGKPLDFDDFTDEQLGDDLLPE